MTSAGLLAWLVPLLLGPALVARALRWPRGAAEWTTTLATGFVLGVLLCALAVGLLGRAPTPRIIARLAPSLLLLAAGAWLWAWRARRDAHVCGTPPVAERMRPFTLLLLALLAVRVWPMADEILLRPPYPWDAWAVWLLQPKAWVLGGHLDAFVGFDHWLADGSGRLRTAEAWNYPDTIGRVCVWFASAHAGWDAPAVAIVWLALWVGLLAGVHGQLRALGLARDPSLIAIYALGSLPLLNVHVALAGYADLWVASVLAFACLAWLRWLQTRRAGHLALALAFAALLPLLKLEGGIWLLIFGGCLVYERMSPRWRRGALALAPAIGSGVVAAYLWHWPWIAPALDRLGLHADTASLLHHAPSVVAAAAAGLFAQYNWHLFWFGVPLTLVLRRRQLAGSPPLRLFGLFLLLGCGFLFALFVLTPAGHWAESYTVVNRLGLQIVPSMLAFCALLWREPTLPGAAGAAGARVAGAVPSGQ